MEGDGEAGAEAPEAAPMPHLATVLDDIAVRFIINTPDALSSNHRLFTQIEQAHWYYEDHIADNHPGMPHYKFPGFAKKLLGANKVLEPMVGQLKERLADYRSFKKTIPLAGCLILNEARDMVLLVRSWDGDWYVHQRR